MANNKDKENLLYIGEAEDYSDQWLLGALRKNFKITVLSPVQKNAFPGTDFSIAINRLYLSASQRFSENDIGKIRSFTNRLPNVINSNNGWELESDRIKQKGFFGSDCIKTFTRAEADNLQDSDFPLVVKRNGFSRNKMLVILRTINDLDGVDNNCILQCLIKQERCFRTEFVGDWFITFDQKIFIQNDRLTFEKNNIKVKDPFAESWYAKIREKLVSIGVEAFSIEYFIVNGKPVIIDFNMTSNYSKEFIINNKKVLLEAWRKLIYEKFI